MPRFDSRCLACGNVEEIWAKPFERPPCVECGGETERLWTTSAKAIADDIPGGQTIEAFGPRLEKFYSKSAIARRAKELGLEPMVRHVPVPGTDKSPHTTSWATISRYQLEAATEMVSRVASVSVPDPEAYPVAPSATPEIVKDLWQQMKQ
jgi:hypothetical protein